jgi:hypothetical protein
MNAIRMFKAYEKRAQVATCSTCRTVSLLGMMCANATKDGGFYSITGQGYGADWPDPRETEPPPQRSNVRRNP